MSGVDSHFQPFWIGSLALANRIADVTPYSAAALAQLV